jgi:hypothetical protein
VFAAADTIAKSGNIALAAQARKVASGLLHLSRNRQLTEQASLSSFHIPVGR